MLSYVLGICSVINSFVKLDPEIESHQNFINLKFVCLLFFLFFFFLLFFFFSFYLLICFTSCLFP